MKNYFDFLDENEQNILNEKRFDNILLDELRYKIITYLLDHYDIHLLPNTPIPTNHQIAAFSKMINNAEKGKYFFAEFMEQGLGKTKLALMYADWLCRKNLIDSILIIAPGELKYQWIKEEVPEHFPHKVDSIVWDGFNTIESRQRFYSILNGDNIRVFSINVEAFSSDTIKVFVGAFCKKGVDTLVIIDESTSIKNGRRKLGPNSKAKRKGAKRTNTILDGFINRKYKLILTGTSTPNKPFDLWAQFEFLKYDFFQQNYWDFCLNYGEMIHVKRANAKKLSMELLDEKTYKLVKYDLVTRGIGICSNKNNCTEIFCKNCGKYDKINPTVKQLEDIALNRGITESAVMRIMNMSTFQQYKNLDILKEKIYPFTFFLKSEEAIDLPPKVYTKLVCEMTKEQKKVYKDMQDNMMAEYDGNTTTTLYKQVMYMRCQQISSGLFPYPIDIIKRALNGDEYILQKYESKEIKPSGKLNALSIALDDIDPDQSIIFWCYFRKEQEIVYSMLCKKYGENRVGLYDGSNKNRIVEAFKNKEILYFVSGDSGSQGLNLQISHLQYFLSNGHRADIRDQKEKRSHRIKQTFPVTYVDCVCKGTKDEKIVELMKRKIDLMDYFRSYKEFNDD